MQLQTARGNPLKLAPGLVAGRDASVTTTTVLTAAGLHLDHVAGVGLVLKLAPGALASSVALTEIEKRIAPAVIGWEQGPIVGDDEELYYPIIGWADLKEANG